MKDPDESGMAPVDSMPRRITVPAYVKQNCKDMTLDTAADFTQFILSLSEKSNVGIHIDRYNSSVLDIELSILRLRCNHLNTHSINVLSF